MMLLRGRPEPGSIRNMVRGNHALKCPYCPLETTVDSCRQICSDATIVTGRAEEDVEEARGRQAESEGTRRSKRRRIYDTTYGRAGRHMSERAVLPCLILALHALAADGSNVRPRRRCAPRIC